MTIINRITRLSVPGVFHDFRWPTDLFGFSRYNLVYGWNGTGKTSLSRVLRALELRTSLSTGQAELSIRNTNLDSQHFASNTTAIRVFNRDFVNDAVFQSSGENVPPIFVVGQESVEKQKKVIELKQQRDKDIQKQQRLNSSKTEAEVALDRFCVDRAKLIKESLRSSGSNDYNNYHKSNFRDRAIKMVADNNKATYRLSEADRNKYRTQCQAQPKSELLELAYRIEDLDRIADDVSKLLASTVISETIEKLKADQGLSKWIQEGLNLHTARGKERCLFCEQTLPQGRIAALEAHFSVAYDNLMRSIDMQIGLLKNKLSELTELNKPNTAELYDGLITEYQVAETSFEHEITEIRSFFEAMVKRLENKMRHPFESLKLEVSVPAINRNPVSILNSVIQQHNDQCKNFETQVQNARDQCALDMISSNLDQFVNLQGDVKHATGDMNRVEKDVERLESEIVHLEKDIVEHRKPAEELNDDLRNYLGHAELRLEVNDTGYTILRGSEPAKALSEGETTAIALLYFLKSLQDKNFDLNKGVVLLDDPVSSLDANALYLAFGFIMERTKDAGQLFIFTHNFNFFRQVKNWFHHLPGQRKKDIVQRPARFYMFDCIKKNNQRSSTITKLDPLLEHYESDYHYMFSRIYRDVHITSESGLKQSYFVPNMARCVLETFLAFRQPDISGGLWKRLNDINFDAAKKIRLLRFVNTYSHADTIGVPQHDPSLLREAKPVLADLLDFIKEQDPQHFVAMEKLAKQSKEEN